MPRDDYFWRKTDKREPDECWPWTGPTSDERGYGRLSWHGHGWYAHRVSYVIHCGSIPGGMYVIHSCDNPSCVNPAHLRIGTAAENTADMIRRGRNKPNQKLSPEQVQEARKLLGQGASQTDIAARFKVSQSTISHLKTGHTYRRKVKKEVG